MLLRYLMDVLVMAIAVILTARIVPGVRIKSFGSAVAFAIVLGIVDRLLYGILLFLAFPWVLASLGLFLLVINTFLWWLADKIVSGVEMDGFGTTLVASTVGTILNWLILFALARFF